MNRRAPLSGFPELLPAQRAAEQLVLDTLRRTFELHGFGNLETRAVEPLDVLLGKGETSKEVYLLRRLAETSEEGHAGMGLHFDLTVPFARYVLEHAGHLEFPFRRHQVQKVWRGERPQDGRFREFTQADIDVVGRDALAAHHDVEVARVMVDAMRRLDFLPGFTLRVNNRKVLQGFYAGLGLDDDQGLATMRTVDKLDKQTPDAVAALLTGDVGLDDATARAVLDLAAVRTDDESFADAVRARGVTHPLLEEGLADLTAVVRGCADLVRADLVEDPGRRVRVVADLSIARGLDYYTGTVFETLLDGWESLGSICSGGRYDSLATDGRTTYPGVGISFGVSRVVVPLVARAGLAADRSVPSAVVVAVTDEESRAQSEGVATALRQRGVPCEVAAAAQRFGKQIRYAERRGVPYVWFPPADAGGPHEVKDIRSGEQVVADPAAWTPPIEDLHPRVRAKEQQ